MICIQNILSASKRRIYKYSVFCLRSFCITELALDNIKFRRNFHVISRKRSRS
jgi:hypothetical protein